MTGHKWTPGELQAGVERLITTLTAPPFSLSVATTVITLGLIAVSPLLVDRFFEPGDRAARKMEVMLKRNVTMEELNELTEGYYEGLLDKGRQVTSVSGVISGRWAADWTRWEFAQLWAHQQRRDDFLYYELKPNWDAPEFDGRLVTNSYGLADREYDLQPAEGTQRCALIGDSMARGLGSSVGANYESLLEDTLNVILLQHGSGRSEILNFGVEGYRITQLVHVARTKASTFSPDCYLLALSDLSVFRKWGQHLGQLVHDGRDLEYPFLEDLARRARLRPDDEPTKLDAKLADFRLEVLRWAVADIRDFARANDAELVVIMVPSVTETHLLEQRFQGVERLVTELDVPVVNLIDTFAEIDPLDEYRRSEYDHHPTDLGHRMIFDALLARLACNPRAWRAVTGLDTAEHCP